MMRKIVCFWFVFFLFASKFNVIIIITFFCNISIDRWFVNGLFIYFLIWFDNLAMNKNTQTKIQIRMYRISSQSIDRSNNRWWWCWCWHNEMCVCVAAASLIFFLFDKKNLNFLILPISILIIRLHCLFIICDIDHNHHWK